ncbi:MAG: hypothetical protein JRG91_20500, partial [Deltaproteobacteria bacterium]|nr:hypothetical protein [Deltaproteobacteria bacterium]
MDYTINYSAERVLPERLVGKALAGKTVYESSCIAKEGTEEVTRFSVRYTQEEADGE